MKRSFAQCFALAFATALLLAPLAAAQETKIKPPPGKASSETARTQSNSLDLLRQLDGSLTELTSKVSRAVVQIQVTGFRPAHKKSSDGGEGTSVLAEEHAIGSGAILHPEGHLLSNGRRIVPLRPFRVRLRRAT